MTNVEGPTCIVSFHDRPSGLGPSSGGDEPALQSIDYLHARERAERRAAKAARSIKARHVHQELAQCYARLIHQRRTAARN